MADRPTRIETVVVGGGQAGLTMSAFLRQAGSEHVVLEQRATLGGGWQDRWDTFRLVTPNWCASFEGYPYDGDDPDGYMPRAEIAARVAHYAEVVEAPVRLETTVRRLARRADAAKGFRLTTSGGTIDADRVVVATGGFHTARIPSAGARIAPRVSQLHSHDYRSEAALPSGAVLVVGSGQTGVQLAEELHAAGRRVYLSVGHCGRAPRRYRGRDFFYWIWQLRNHGTEFGTPLPTVDTLPDPRLRLACNPQLSGHGGGHDVDLRRFAAEGITLLGRFDDADDERVRLAPDLASNLQFADAFFDLRFRVAFDTFIERSGADVPPDDGAATRPLDFEPPAIVEVNLAAEGISTIIWTSGYRLDYGWIDAPIFDEMGFPRHERGMTAIPGLVFLGLPWLVDQGSATLFGVKRDGADLIQRMDGSTRRR